MTRKDGRSCEYCGAGLKRQFVGSNVFYYCKRCGRITSGNDIALNDIALVEAACSMVGACV
jgi:DNA-directed RNA polymerase subunit RPC12/RpoP